MTGGAWACLCEWVHVFLLLSERALTKTGSASAHSFNPSPPHYPNCAGISWSLAWSAWLTRLLRAASHPLLTALPPSSASPTTSWVGSSSLTWHAGRACSSAARAIAGLVMETAGKQGQAFVCITARLDVKNFVCCASSQCGCTLERSAKSNAWCLL